MHIHCRLFPICKHNAQREKENLTEMNNEMRLTLRHFDLFHTNRKTLADLSTSPQGICLYSLSTGSSPQYFDINGDARRKGVKEFGKQSEQLSMVLTFHYSPLSSGHNIVTGQDGASSS